MLRKDHVDHPVGRKPAWLRVRSPGGENYVRVKRSLRNLHTVCEEARCPNIGDCWGCGTATFMLLGDTCTRACAFCAVKTGNPRGAVDHDEPARLAESVAGLGLRYVVLTTVDRDDLADGGAAHIGATIRSIRERQPDILVEVLTGDFQGAGGAIDAVLDESPDVFAHNIETVDRLTNVVRDRRASYGVSLEVLRRAGERLRDGYTKSSIMLGVGETEAEVVAALRDLRDRGVDFLTIGQYLRPSARHLPVTEYVPPERFDELRRIGLGLGFRSVASGPLVRSSYRAGEELARVITADRRPCQGETGPPS